VNRRAEVEPESLAARGGELPSARNSCTVPVTEGYERWAPIYDRTPNPLLACEERHLMPWFADLRNKSILDVGCGTGRWLHRLTTLGGQPVAGIDFSVAMLRVAEKKGAIRGRLASAACENLPFRAAVFDLAVCSFVLGHIRVLGPMVSELARVMRPGADVFVSDLHPDAYARGWRVGFRDNGATVQIEMLPRAAEEIVQLFYSNGLECLKQVPLYLGDPEKPIFARAGKAHSFREACQLSAILVFHFRRLDSPIDRCPAVMTSLKTDHSTPSPPETRAKVGN